MSSELIHRLHFAFTVTFHYLFPQLTMGLGLLIVVLKTVALKTDSDKWNRAARFWGRIFAINFVFGVVTGIPMEFEFGTNWARFSNVSGGVIGQPLAHVEQGRANRQRVHIDDRRRPRPLASRGEDVRGAFAVLGGDGDGLVRHGAAPCDHRDAGPVATARRRVQPQGRNDRQSSKTGDQFSQRRLQPP